MATNKDLFMGGFAKILKEQLLVDVRLKAKDSDSAICVHKIVLSARSVFFKKLLLESDEIKSSSSADLETITLSDMTHKELEAFIDFIYSDGSALSTNAKKHVRSLYVAADKYMIPHLRDLCRDELISSLCPENALGIIELAQIPFDDDLNDAAFDMITTNISTVAGCDEFNQFVVKHTDLAVELIRNSFSPLSSNRNYYYCNHRGRGRGR